MSEQVLKRVVKFSHKNLGFVVTNTKFLLCKSNGIFKVGADPALEINVCLGGFGQNFLFFQ
jgi:hypothetical protein